MSKVESIQKVISMIEKNQPHDAQRFMEGDPHTKEFTSIKKIIVARPQAAKVALEKELEKIDLAKYQPKTETFSTKKPSYFNQSRGASIIDDSKSGRNEAAIISLKMWRDEYIGDTVEKINMYQQFDRIISYFGDGRLQASGYLGLMNICRNLDNGQ